MIAPLLGVVAGRGVSRRGWVQLEGLLGCCWGIQWVFECPRPAPSHPSHRVRETVMLTLKDQESCVTRMVVRVGDCTVTVLHQRQQGKSCSHGRPWHPGTNIPVCSSECTGASHEVQTAGDFIVISTQTSPSILLLHQVEVLKGILQILMGGRERHTPDRVTVECWILQGHVVC